MDMLKSMKESLMCAAQTQMGNLSQVDAQELGAVVDMIKDLSETIYYCTITEAMEKAEKEEKNGGSYNTTVYYNDPRYPMMYRDMDREQGRMYYPMYEDGRMYAERRGNPGGGDGRRGGRRGYSESEERMYAQGGGGQSGGNSGSSGGNSGGSSSGGSSSGGNGGGSSSYYHERQIPYDQMMMMRDLREGKSPQQRRMYMETKEKHHDKAKQLQELEKYVKELSQDLVEMIEDASPEEKQYLGNRISALASKITHLEND